MDQIKELKKGFHAYKYPFKNSDEKLKEMNADMKEKYLRGAYQFVESGALDGEIGELVRQFVGEIAFKITDMETLAAYRSALTFIQRFESRIKFLSAQYNQKENPKNVITQL